MDSSTRLRITSARPLSSATRQSEVPSARMWVSSFARGASATQHGGQLHAQTDIAHDRQSIDVTARVWTPEWAAQVDAPLLADSDELLTVQTCDLNVLRRLKVVHGSYVRIDNAERSHIARLLLVRRNRVVVSTEQKREDDDDEVDDDEDAIIVSPLLAFNLGIALHAVDDADADATVTMRAVHPQELGLDATPASTATSFRRSRQEQPVQAESATIAPLLSSSLACRDHAVLKDRDGLLHAIREFFATPRVLQEGDIFAIALRETTAPIDLIANERSAALYSPYKPVEIPEALVANRDKHDASASDLVVLQPTLDVDTSLVFFRVERLQSERNTGSPLACSVSSGSQLVQATSTTAQAPDEATIKAYLSQRRFGAGSSSSAAMSSASSGVPSKAFRELYDVLYPSQICDVPVSVLLSGPRGVGKTTLVHHVAKQLGIATVEMPFTEVTGQSELHLLENLRDQVAKAQALTPCVLYISRFFPVEKENEEAELRLGAVLSECIRSLSRDYKHNIPLIACVEDVNEVPKFIRQCFLYEMVLEAPDQSTRLEVLEHLTQSTRLDASVDLKEIAQTTAGRTCGELSALIADAGARAVERIVAEASSESLLEQLVLDDDEDLSAVCSIRQEELEYAIKNQQSQSSSAKIGNASIPNVKWDDVGGLEDVKDEILDVVQLPIKHPELFASGVRQRSGILLYGPPGTGKTLLAKAIATECGLNFLSVKGPELLNMYIGESEKNVRQVFAKARSCRPCILFFDELDSLAPMRGRGSDSGGVMDRVVSQLLTEIDGLSGSSSGNDQVFVIGATNRPDLLETGLLRPGRFDRLLYLGICNEKSAQLKVVQALTRKFTLAKDVVLEDVVANCPLNFTGADFYALASSSLAAALKDRVEALDRQVDAINAEDCYSSSPMTVRQLLHKLPAEELCVPVGQSHFLAALAQVMPSVSEAELRHYENLKEQYSSK